MLSLLAASGAAEPIYWENLGLRPYLFEVGGFQLRFYSLAYLLGILFAYWHLSKMIKAPGAPMAQRHADDLFFYCTLGVILGGRIGYAAFYKPELFASADVFKLWEGGMSFHGGVIGDIDIRMRRHFRAAIAAHRDHREPFGLRAVGAGVKMGGRVIVDHPDQLVDQEGETARILVAGRRLGLQPALEFGALLVERGLEQLHDRPTRLLAMLLHQRADFGGKPAPVDDRALAGNLGRAQAGRCSLA